MSLHVTVQQSLWFLPFAVPICLWVIWSDLRDMRIPNHAVLALAGVFLVVGLFVVPQPEYLWRLAALVVMLVIGMLANAAGMMGAGDSKFLAAAAPFIAIGDLTFLLLILATNMLACYATHRLVRGSRLRQLAPDWASWSSGPKFPMGFALGSTLIIYLGLGVAFGS
ncbi:prepilin peptidase [Marivita sp.]|uniref:prepilin peptidase n=1 Tax=Marivita sp. TaxID=2003365 RepID=UPI0025C56E14|nr:prepilin peptidase [Marivita sp.]